MALFSRRDPLPQSDYLHRMVDAYNDRRTGVRPTVNPRGVKRDGRKFGNLFRTRADTTRLIKASYGFSP